jgi:hypothetical protein
MQRNGSRRVCHLANVIPLNIFFWTAEQPTSPLPLLETRSPSLKHRCSVVDRITLNCLHHSSDCINDHAGMIILNVVTATLRNNEISPRRKTSELSLQVHQGGLPFLEKWSVISRGNYRERDVWKRAGCVRNLLVAFGNTLFLKIGR